MDGSLVVLCWAALVGMAVVAITLGAVAARRALGSHDEPPTMPTPPTAATPDPPSQPQPGVPTMHLLEGNTNPGEVPGWLEMPGTFTLPVDLISRLAQQDRLARAEQKEMARVHAIANGISKDGVTRPVVITVDSMGKLILQDGHHLLVAAQGLGLTHLPCRVQISDGNIKIRAELVSNVLEDLLLAANTHRSQA